MTASEKAGWVARLAHAVRAWPLSAKVMGALALALLPLGVLALSAANTTYSEMGRTQERLVRARVEALSQAAAPRVDALVSTLRAAAVLGGGADCRVGLGGLASTSGVFRDIALFDAGGRLLCASGAGDSRVVLTREAALPPLSGAADQAEAARDPLTGDLVILLRRPVGAGQVTVAAGRIEPDRAASLIATTLLGAGEGARLTSRGRAVAAVGPAPATSGSRSSLELLPGLAIDVWRPAPRLSVAQALAVALPALMWLTAMGICWVAIDSLVADPLRRIRGAVDRYGRGDRSVRTVPAAGSTHELQQFARAFDLMADRADKHEAEMQEALARQTALTREVHHRVKNNLQIVSSLLSIQARDVDSPEVAAAYALIRQRVTALSLVHRWIYAGSPEAGVDLRGLLADLSANLANSFERTDGGRLAVTCTAAQLLVHQDTALPIAFLVSELAVNAAQRGASWVRVSALEAGDAGDLSVSSDAFTQADIEAANDPASARIIAGLVRQLRGTLAHDGAQGYRIRFASLRRPAAA